MLTFDWLEHNNTDLWLVDIKQYWSLIGWQVTQEDLQEEQQQCLQEVTTTVMDQQLEPTTSLEPSPTRPTPLKLTMKYFMKPWAKSTLLCPQVLVIKDFINIF